MILEWIDVHKRHTGEWPNKHSGPVVGGYLGDNWRKIDNALKLGLRGLRGGDSLAKLLIQARGVRIKHYAPDLNEGIILEWADRHREQTGRWPTEDSGEVESETGENWNKINAAHREGLRGLPGKSSLAKLVAVHEPTLPDLVRAYTAVPLDP
jgi:hypothetical protein